MHAPRGRELAVAEVIAEVEAPVAREQSAFASRVAHEDTKAPRTEKVEYFS